MQIQFLKKEELFNHLGISLRDDEGQFRETHEILSDLAKAWQGLDKIQREYYTQALFKEF